MKAIHFQYKEANFYAEEQGQGKALIFLHGFLENRQMWAPVLEALPNSYRKITLDLPGHGKSDNLAYVHSMEEMAEVVMALVKHLRLKKFTLIGHSMGGYVALALADKYPDNLKALVLMNSNSRADSLEKQMNRDRAISLVKRNPKSYVRSAIPLLFRPKNRQFLKEQVALVKEQAMETSAQGIVAALEGMKQRLDREMILAFAPYPILFIASKKDPVLEFEMLKEQMQYDKVESLILEDGHMSHLENPKELFEGLKAFLHRHL